MSDFQSESEDEEPPKSQSPPDAMIRAAKDGSGKFKKPIVIDLDGAFCWGVTKNSKYENYEIPVVLDLDSPEAKLLVDVALRNGADLEFFGKFGNLLYLRCSTLSEDQISEMVGQGKMTVGVEFSIVGTYAKKNGSGLALSIRVNAIGKLGEAQKMVDPAPRAYRKK